MTSTKESFSFKRVLSELPRGEPLSTAALLTYGVSAFRASALARAGWLTHLGRGVYMLPGDTLTRDGCLAYLGHQMPGLHVGGKTALAWRGIRQNISFREVLTLWGDEPKRLPAWFTQRFASRYQSTQLFDGELPNGFGLSQSQTAGLKYSSPYPSEHSSNFSATSEKLNRFRKRGNSSRACARCARRPSTICWHTRRGSRLSAWQNCSEESLIFHGPPLPNGIVNVSAVENAGWRLQNPASALT